MQNPGKMDKNSSNHHVVDQLSLKMGVHTVIHSLKDTKPPNICQGCTKNCAFFSDANSKLRHNFWFIPKKYSAVLILSVLQYFLYIINSNDTARVNMFFQKLVSRENILFDEFFVGKRLVSKQLARKKAGLGHISRPSACLLCPVLYTMAAFGIFSPISIQYKSQFQAPTSKK